MIVVLDKEFRMYDSCEEEIKFAISKLEQVIESKPKTNADRIRNMTDDELAEFLVRVNGAYAKDCMVGIEVCKYDDCADMDCEDCFLEWLQAEVEEGAE